MLYRSDDATKHAEREELAASSSSSLKLSVFAYAGATSRVLIALFFCAAYAPLAPPARPHILSAILNGQSVERHGAILGVAMQSMVSGAVCDPCWVVGGGLTPGGWPSELESKKSIHLLKYYSGGAVAHSNLKGSTGQMIDPALLCVLWSISPDSYFFAFPKDGVLHAVKATATPYSNQCGEIPRVSKDAEPEWFALSGSNKERNKLLFVVLRLAGVQLLFTGVAHLLKGDEHLGVGPLDPASDEGRGHQVPALTLSGGRGLTRQARRR